MDFRINVPGATNREATSRCASGMQFRPILRIGGFDYPSRVARLTGPCGPTKALPAAQRANPKLGATRRGRYWAQHLFRPRNARRPRRGVASFPSGTRPSSTCPVNLAAFSGWRPIQCGRTNIQGLQVSTRRAFFWRHRVDRCDPLATVSRPFGQTGDFPLPRRAARAAHRCLAPSRRRPALCLHLPVWAIERWWLLAGDAAHDYSDCSSHKRRQSLGQPMHVWTFALLGGETQLCDGTQNPDDLPERIGAAGQLCDGLTLTDAPHLSGDLSGDLSGHWSGHLSGHLPGKEDDLTRRAAYRQLSPHCEIPTGPNTKRHLGTIWHSTRARPPSPKTGWGAFAIQKLQG